MVEHVADRRQAELAQPGGDLRPDAGERVQRGVQPLRVRRAPQSRPRPGSVSTLAKAVGRVTRCEYRNRSGGVNSGSARSGRRTSRRRRQPGARALRGRGRRSAASGSSSAAAIQTIAPAAKPSPAGRIERTARRRGRPARPTAAGEAREDAPAGRGADRTPRGTSTRLIAKPSGMLCTAIAIAITRPKASPPPNDAPTPTPSAAECAVITPTISAALRASAPLKPAEVRYRHRSPATGGLPRREARPRARLRGPGAGCVRRLRSAG